MFGVAASSGKVLGLALRSGVGARALRSLAGFGFVSNFRNFSVGAVNNTYEETGCSKNAALLPTVVARVLPHQKLS
jgi:hypothetical protein